MKKMHQDVYIGIAGFLLCCLFWYGNSSLPADSKLLPNIYCIILALFSILILIDGIKKTNTMHGNEQYLTWDVVKIPSILLLLIGAYVLLFYLCGYMLATPVMLFILMHFLKRKSWSEILVVIAGYMIFVYCLFVVVLKVPINNFGWIGNYLATH